MIDLPSQPNPAPDLRGGERVRAVLDMWFKDHGFIRDIYCNRHQISPQAWRSAQVAPHHVEWAKEHGIKTILNLRGRRDTCGSYILEREACQRYGLTLIDFPLRSRGPLLKPTIHAIADLFPRLEYPILLHCKSGADRAGMMSTFYQFLQEGVPLPKAMEQLSLRYGHVKQAKTGIIDFFFASYLAYTEKRPMAFLDWVDQVYEPETLLASFKEDWLAGVLVNRILKRE